MSDHLAPNPWHPVAHEDAPADPAPTPAPTSRLAKPKAEPTPGASIPIAMALMIPPELTAALSALVEGQAALTEQIGKLIASNAEVLARIASTPPLADAGEIE